MGRSIRASSLGAALIVGALVCTGSARAETPGTDEAMSESLFREGKELMARGSYAEACPKFAESQRLDPGTGTLLALAFCHEKEGKVASAWAEYATVLAAAQKAQQIDREKVARERIAALEPQLPHLTLRVSAATRKIPDLAVKRDGIAIGDAAFGTSSPVDPGAHVVDAEAPGKKPFHAEVTLKPAESKELTIPDLEAAPAPPVVVAPPDTNRSSFVEPPKESPPDGGGRRAFGYVVGGAGIAAIGVGSVFGVIAIKKASDANDACPNTRCSDAGAVQKNGDAKTAATISTVTFAVGAVAVAAGIYLVLSAPSSHDAPARTSASPRRVAWTPGGFAW